MAKFISHNTQRPSGNVISSDLKNNIGISTILGDFGTSESTLTLDDDYSALSKPEIKGRGFVKSGQNIYEYQSFFVDIDTLILKKKDGFYNDGNDIIQPEEKIVDIVKHEEEAEEIETELDIDIQQRFEEDEEDEDKVEDFDKVFKEIEEKNKVRNILIPETDPNIKIIKLDGLDLDLLEDPKIKKIKI